MSSEHMNRREFVGRTAAVAGALGVGTADLSAQKTKASAASRRSILNFNGNMEYRCLGKTGLMVSAVCHGGHWKRVGVMIDPAFQGTGYSDDDWKILNNPAFVKNRSDVLSRAMELGINYVDACSPQEILAYSRVLKGRRDQMYLGFSWYTREPQLTEWRTGKKLIEGFDQSLKEAGLDYVDLWRISLPKERIADLGELLRIEEATVAGLEMAKKQGKARFTGISTHNRVWLKSVIEQYPQQIEVVLFPYTAASRELPGDSLFDAIRKHNVGAFGIKPFADRALFTGDSALHNANAEEDDRRARLAIRYILSNPAITAPIPGLINTHQVENVARAVAERKKLDPSETAEIDKAGGEMWSRLDAGHQWLPDGSTSSILSQKFVHKVAGPCRG